jgi:hypothetical protein
MAVHEMLPRHGARFRISSLPLRLQPPVCNLLCPPALTDQVVDDDQLIGLITLMELLPCFALMAVLEGLSRRMRLASMFVGGSPSGDGGASWHSIKPDWRA